MRPRVFRDSDAADLGAELLITRTGEPGPSIIMIEGLAKGGAAAVLSSLTPRKLGKSFLESDVLCAQVPPGPDASRNGLGYSRAENVGPTNNHGLKGLNLVLAQVPGKAVICKCRADGWRGLRGDVSDPLFPHKSRQYFYCTTHELRNRFFKYQRKIRRLV